MLIIRSYYLDSWWNFLPYQVLRHFDESPQMPQGYPAMMIMAMIPPLWFKVMDNRLETWKAESGLI